MRPLKLSTLKIANFRCFSDHEVEFTSSTLIVGRNNAGKSTLVEALRYVSLVTERMHGLAFKAPPESLDLGLGMRGLQPSIDSLTVHEIGIFYKYGQGPARISATFTNGCRIDVYISEKPSIHAVIYNERGRQVTAHKELSNAIPVVSILPQITPLMQNEKVLNDDYVKAMMQTSRSSLHFRNQLRLFTDDYGEFRRVVEGSWPGIEVLELVEPTQLDDDRALNLLLRDGDFSAEVGWMGHGLQMWLQTMWFLVRSRKSSVLILDEPDVYMHADLQRRLIRMLNADERQFIVATHSPEMMAEVKPESILVLDRTRKKSKSTASSVEVQEILQHVGSVHNLSLAKLAVHNKIVFVEGDDMQLLKQFQNIIDPASSVPIDVLPSMSIGGWTQWQSVLAVARFFKENDVQIEVHCLFDTDYHLDEEITKRYSEASDSGVRLTILKSKEIENYAIVPRAIASLLSAKSGAKVSPNQVSDHINQVGEAMLPDTIDSYASEIHRLDRSLDLSTCNKRARAVVERKVQENGLRRVVSGKEMFARIQDVSRTLYGATYSVNTLIGHVAADEIDIDLVQFIRSLQ
jgi:energy-coupling factor transporter ATP-binding protein EcfA2